MDFSFQNLNVVTPEGTVSLIANVQAVVNAINTNTVIPYGDYGGANVYWFQTMNNGLGNIIYTIFDKDTTLGLASYMARYGAATKIVQILYEPFPRSEIELQLLVLPNFRKPVPRNGTVTP